MDEFKPAIWFVTQILGVLGTILWATGDIYNGFAEKHHWPNPSEIVKLVGEIMIAICLILAFAFPGPGTKAF